MLPPEPRPAPASAAIDPDFDAPARRALGPFAGRESALLIAAAAFQLAVLGWMIAGTLWTFRETRTVYVKVAPVDPRDLFRGEYVTLSYDFSRVPPGGVEGLPGPYTYDNESAWRNHPVFVPLTAEPDGKHYRSGPPRSTPPEGDVPYLQGTLDDESQIAFGVESFYVQEGRGAEYEAAARDHKLWAEIGLTAQGQGILKGLAIE
ncbi:GDYXXLXY domain-containing protein [Paludisphaera mucosa]|uniref:GDYXXLXY domain-containing protein n=1 Tax=Paludisphaera mucosa TaxID=3030827 RepID=A0ABT6FIM9_9BACT|nr:GDYXXLXY domain-containing protein [Paludisphaera mucosa]MDG3007443.1 GDYXXLXY domain-containing protein [Paludisphaera mucosa]